MGNLKPLPILEQPDTFWAYLAGYVDGEGSITLCMNGPRFIVTNTHKPTLEHISASIGFGTIQENTARGNIERRTRPCYTLNVGANGMRSLLPRLIPFLIEKKERAERMMDYLNAMSSNPHSRHIPGHIEGLERAREAFLATVPDAWANKAEV